MCLNQPIKFVLAMPLGNEFGPNGERLKWFSRHIFQTRCGKGVQGGGSPPGGGLGGEAPRPGVPGGAAPRKIKN